MQGDVKVLISAELFLASPNPNKILVPLEGAEDLGA